MTLREIAGVREIAADYDGFVLDLWGVVHDGVSPYPGVAECLRALLDAGKRIALLSNAPRRAYDVVNRITAIGVPQGLYHAVMSSGEEAWQYLKERSDPFYAGLGRKCLHICSDRDLEIRVGLDLDYVESATAAEFILNTGPAGWDDTIADYAPILKAARERGLKMVCANPDLMVNHGEKLALCAGALAVHYEEIGGEVRWHGKPYPSVYESTLRLLGIADQRRVLAVGDSLRTDIAGANGAGIDSLLIAGQGIHLDEFAPTGTPDIARIEAAAAVAGVKPTMTAARFVW
ncbi:MAG TPA: TIGR01459 family HAD-type hydrolase [Stellaceae bacterium]|jgi:HAD superfamily hydrolase (TIGR01459 family)|nr:TIGR01459 family HAD-type hydrolase [Stellaceae bacterium]